MGEVKAEEVWKSTHREIDALSISPFDSTYFALGLSSLSNTYWDGEIVILQKQSNEKFLEVKHQFTSSGIGSVAWLGDKTNPLIVGAGDDGNIHYLSLNNDLTGKIVAHDNYVTKVIANSDNSKFLSCSADKRIILWELGTEFPLRPIESYDEHKSCVNGVSWNKGTENFASVSSDGFVKLWSRSSSNSTSSIKLSCETLSVCWNDNYLFVGKVDGSIDALDIRKFDAPLHSTPVHQGSVTSLHTISSTKIASGSNRGVVGIHTLGENASLSNIMVQCDGNITGFDSVVKEDNVYLYSTSWGRSLVLLR